MTTLKRYFDLIMPEIILPKNKEMLGNASRVKSDSPKDMRFAMYEIARIFKRELQFD